MAESTVVEMNVVRSLACRVDELLADVRPLRALFEDAALEVRTALLQQGMPEPLLEATLDLCYAQESSAGKHAPLTVAFPLEIENAAVCLSDPLPLDSQALRQAVAAFHLAHAERHGRADRSAAVQVVMLRVRGYGHTG